MRESGVQMQNVECAMQSDKTMQNGTAGSRAEQVKRLKDRTKHFALNVIRLVNGLAKNRVSDIISRQLIRSATSAGANYRAACRARSNADFISKMGIVEEELDESMYWFELLEESGVVQRESLSCLTNEANELLAITVSSIRTAKDSKRKI